MTAFEKEIYEMKQEFCDNNGGVNPTKLLVPRNKENEFILIDGYPPNKSVGDYFKKIQGLEIVCDADEFKVE